MESDLHLNLSLIPSPLCFGGTQLYISCFLHNMMQTNHRACSYHSDAYRHDNHSYYNPRRRGNNDDQAHRVALAAYVPNSQDSTKQSALVWAQG